MKIGIDVDGVILNFERELKTYGEIFNCFEIDNKKEANKNAHYVNDRYSWTEEQENLFAQKYFIECSKKCPFMAGAINVINKLKNEGHQLIIISARGGKFAEMEDVALERLNAEGLVFDKYYWHIDNKVEIAKKENLDFMIDDYYKHIKELTENKIKSIYFRDVDMPKLEDNKYLYDATNWGEVYRIIKTYENK